LGTLHEDKPLDAKAIMAKTDVISAMEAIEGAALREKPRKKTPPLSQKEEERKKALIRWAETQHSSNIFPTTFFTFSLYMSKL
jgi:hypothetical protein